MCAFFFIALRCVPRCKDFFITARTVPPVDHADTQSKCFLGAGCSRRGKVEQHRAQRICLGSCADEPERIVRHQREQDTLAAAAAQRMDQHAFKILQAAEIAQNCSLEYFQIRPPRSTVCRGGRMQNKKRKVS